ncbi:hypothetical protein [Flavobacterium covae]|uniref:hypothetical protein n=1 Tax=Flavobacterium covae TaxID=2906076 RepID=UPI0011AA8047|nr:hypothetical protein [Flavobacterium covae]
MDNLSCYSKKYPVNKLKPLVKASSAFQEFGQIGKKLINTVDNEVESIFTKYNVKEIRDKTMISGMTYKKDIQNRIFKATNFTREEIANGEGILFQKFKENLHPTLLNRLNKHILKVRAKNVLASESDILRAGRAGAHGEIRVLNDLLWEIDPKGLLGEQIFNDIVGYNRFLRNGAEAIQPPCVHCYYLTSGVKFIGF